MKVSRGILTRLRRTIETACSEFGRIHSDQRGSISIISVFVLMMFTMLMIMIVNIGTHVDDKLKMQNAVDASTYSGGLVLARGMNSLAYTNHLLCDVFALTAFLREASGRNAEQLVLGNDQLGIEGILSAWDQTADVLMISRFQKFADIGRAVDNRVPKEYDTVLAYAEMNAAAAEMTLPVFEYILSERLIGHYQRAIIQTLPEVAQAATDEVARRHGLLGRSTQEGSSQSQMRYEQERGRQFGVLWNTNATPVWYEDESNPMTRTLPAIDPDPNEQDFPQLVDADRYMAQSLEQRRNLSNTYLRQWNFDRLRLFRYEARMNLFFYLWRIATCGHLDQLLNFEYPTTNLPIVMRHLENGDGMERVIRRAENMLRPLRTLSRRRDPDHPIVMDNIRQQMDLNEYIDRDFHFVGVAYRRHRNEIGPGLFENPMARNSDAQTFAQVRIFIPRPRKVLNFVSNNPNSDLGLGGTYGFTSTIELSRGEVSPATRPDPSDKRWGLEGWPTHWDLLNQNWMVQLVPATTPTLNYILSGNPGGELEGFRPPDYSGANSRTLKRINHH